MPQHLSDRNQSSVWDFNKEIIFGECGALLMAYVAAFTAAHFTRQAAIISGSIVAGTLLGGTIFWLTARILHQSTKRRWSAVVLAKDIGYFTPAAITFSFVVYDPAIFIVSHHLLVQGNAVGFAVVVAQVIAFALFLAGMNIYRIILAKVRGKHL